MADSLTSLMGGGGVRINLRIRRRLIVQRIQVAERQTQKLLLVPPLRLARRKALALGRRRRRVRYLGDEVRGALFTCQPPKESREEGGTHRLGNTVYQHPQQRHPEQHIKPDTKPKQQPLPTAEPLPLFIRSKLDAGKVRFQQLSHQTPRRKVTLQENHQISPGQKHAGAKDDARRSKPHCPVERPETGRGQHEAADVRHVGQGKDSQREGALAGEAVQEQRH